MKVLITGGTGFLGSHLVRRWRKRGWEITVLSRDPRQVGRLFGEGVLGVALDQMERLPKRGKPFDLEVNLAGAPLLRWPWPDHYKGVLLESRVGTTRKLVRYLSQLEERPDLLISGSAVGYYGDRGDQLLDENSSPPKTADFGYELCAAWEEAALEARPLGIRVCIVRTGLVLSKDGGFLARLLPLFRVGLGFRIGSGRQWISWIHLEDYVAIYDFIIEHATLEGPFNGTAPEPVTHRELVEQLARAVGRPVLLTVPEWGLRLVAGELAQLLLASQRAIPRRLMEAGFPFSYPKLEWALKALFEN